MTEIIQDIVRDLHDRAADRTGLDDFGDGSYLEGLNRYVSALSSDLGLSGVSLLEAAETSARGALVGRLHLQAGWSARPDYRHKKVEAPLVITGLPRTGTTALHQFLSLDRQFQGLESWLVSRPAPRPPRDEWEQDVKFRLKKQEAAASRPLFEAIHWVDADQLDECQGLMAQTFVSGTYGSQRSIPSYDDWYLAQDQRPAFRRLTDALRLIGIDSDKPWLLKNPSHILALDALLEAMPDARIVITHRDPAAALPSVASLLWILRRARGGDFPDMDPVLIGARELRVWKVAAERALDVVADHGNRILHVSQQQLSSNPLAVARQIYGHFGMTLDAETEAAMKRWAGEPSVTHGGHRYDASDFGFDKAALAQQFASFSSLVQPIDA